MANQLHQRKVIRDAAVAALVAAGTSAEDRIYPTRDIPWKRGVIFPTASVYVTTEKSDDRKSAPREYQRKAQLRIEAVVKPGAESNVDDALDAFSLELERGMASDPTFGGACSDATLTDTQLDFGEKGDQTVGLLTLTYAVTYYTDAPYAADVTLDALETIDVKTRLGGTVVEGNQTEDVVEVIP